MSSIAATSYPAIVQEAVAEAVIKARDLGFRQVLLLTDCKRLAQVCNMKGQPKVARSIHDEIAAMSNTAWPNHPHYFCS